MNRIRNKKFLSIVENLKHTTNPKADYIDIIQLKNNYLLSFPFKNRYNKSLLNIFNETGKINRTSNSVYNYDKKKSFDNSSNNHIKNSFDNGSNNHIKNSFDNEIQKNNIGKYSDKLNIIYLNQLKKTIPSINLIFSIKKGDYYSDIFFKSIDNLYDTLDYSEKREYIKNMKLKIIDVFNKQGFYKKFNYSTKDFKKSDLDHYFTSNLPISLGMLKVYSDVFSVNLVYKNTNNTNTYMTSFDKNRATLIIYDSNDRVYGIKNKTDYFRGNSLKNFLKYDKIPIKEILEKMKIGEIQNIARMLNISTKKQGKVSKINKVKIDLINEILI